MNHPVYDARSSSGAHLEDTTGLPLPFLLLFPEGEILPESIPFAGARLIRTHEDTAKAVWAPFTLITETRASLTMHGAAGDAPDPELVPRLRAKFVAAVALRAAQPEWDPIDDGEIARANAEAVADVLRAHGLIRTSEAHTLLSSACPGVPGDVIDAVIADRIERGFRAADTEVARLLAEIDAAAKEARAAEEARAAADAAAQKVITITPGQEGVIVALRLEGDYLSPVARIVNNAPAVELADGRKVSVYRARGGLLGVKIPAVAGGISILASDEPLLVRRGTWDLAVASAGGACEEIESALKKARLSAIDARPMTKEELRSDRATLEAFAKWLRPNLEQVVQSTSSAAGARYPGTWPYGHAYTAPRELVLERAVRGLCLPLKDVRAVILNEVAKYRKRWKFEAYREYGSGEWVREDDRPDWTSADLSAGLLQAQARGLYFSPGELARADATEAPAAAGDAFAQVVAATLAGKAFVKTETLRAAVEAAGLGPARGAWSNESNQRLTAAAKSCGYARTIQRMPGGKDFRAWSPMKVKAEAAAST